MLQKPTQQVDPNTVRNSCAGLVEALATNAKLSDDQIIPPLEALDAETLLAMFCVTHLWALDCFARLIGIEPSVTDLAQSIQDLGSVLPKLGKSELTTLAITGDGTSLLFLATAFDALRMMSIAIEKKLEHFRIGRQYVNFRKSGSQENLDSILKSISPKRGYYRIKGEPIKDESHESDDRTQDIYTGFFTFVDRLKKGTVGDWKDFPHTALADHRPAPHPEWDNKFGEFFEREIENTLRDDLLVITGKLENAPLEMRTVIRDKYRKWCGEIDLRVSENEIKKVTPLHSDLELCSDDDEIPRRTPEELRNTIAPEILFSQKKGTAQLEVLKTADPELYQALTEDDESETKSGGINKTAVGRKLGITPQAVEKRLAKVRAKIRRKFPNSS